MKHNTRSGIICLVLATVLWSFTAIFVKHFSIQSVDREVQNLFRYVAATVSLWLFIIAFSREALFRALGRWHVFLLPAAINCAFQTAMVSGLYAKSIYPGFSSLLGRSSVVFSAILAFIIYRNERNTILSWRYLVGCCVAIVGVVGVVMFGEQSMPDFHWGVFFVILAAFLWACYTIAMKRVVGHTSPVISFAIVAAYTTIFFVILTFVRSRPAQFFEMSLHNQGLMLLSGVVCIAAGQALYFHAVKRLGIAVCASFLLLQPLITGVVSAVLFHEALNARQIIMGAVLLAGAFLVVLAGRQYSSGVATSRKPLAPRSCTDSRSKSPL